MQFCFVKTVVISISIDNRSNVNMDRYLSKVEKVELKKNYLAQFVSKRYKMSIFLSDQISLFEPF